MSKTITPVTYLTRPKDYDALDASFYCNGDHHSFVGTVVGTRGDFLIYCDGMMKIIDNDTDSVYCTAMDLIDAGYRTDDALNDATEHARIEWVNNPWFSITDYHGEELDIAHTLDDALAIARAYAEGER